MRNIISFWYHLFTMDDLVWNINNVSHFLHLKFHFGHKKWTSQKWCLEVHRTFSQEFGAKKRLSMVKIIRNCQFLSKNEWKKFKKSIFFIHLEILFEKWNRSQVWCFSIFLQTQHVKIGCTMQNLARQVCKNVWGMVNMEKKRCF